MGLKEVFQQQGGIKLVKHYLKNGTLLIALCQFILLGKERTALEILRLSTQYKIKRKLERHYYKIIKDSDDNYVNSLPHNLSNKVWVCWLQGMENAPKLVKQCYESIKRNLTDREIIIITEENMQEYITLPDYVLKKWKAGIITHTHLTDLLRLELLIQYGGMWLDATVFCSENRKNIPDYFFNSDLFFYQNLKPGRDGDGFYMSSWLISAKTNNKILITTRNMCYEYWKENNSMDDYYLLHAFMSIVLDHFPDEWNSVFPRDNATPHILLLRLFEPYKESWWKSLKEQTPFHKLSYKYDKEKENLQDTFFHKVMNI